MPNITEPGRYPATIKNAEIGQTNSGTPYASLYCETEDGKHITAFLYLSEKAFDNSLDALKKLGFDCDFENIAQLNGAACSLTCENETFNGETRMKVRYINPPRKETPQGLAAMLTAKAKGNALAKPAAPVKPAAKPVAPVKPAPAATVEDDSDVPF
jgi:hypothetical protein